MFTLLQFKLRSIHCRVIKKTPCLQANITTYIHLKSNYYSTSISCICVLSLDSPCFGKVPVSGLLHHKHHQSRTQGLPKDFTPYGPKYNFKHTEHILSQPCTIHKSNSQSEPNINICTINRRL